MSDEIETRNPKFEIVNNIPISVKRKAQRLKRPACRTGRQLEAQKFLVLRWFF